MIKRSCSYLRRADILIWLVDPLVAVLGHISLSGHHLAGFGRLARASNPTLDVKLLFHL